MKDYSKHVLFVGPHYRLRGGMASVLEVYAQFIPGFRFQATYKYKEPLRRILFFMAAMLRMSVLFIFSRQIKIVHIHAACRGSFIRKSLVLHLARLLGKKTILHLHGGEFKLYYRESGRLKPYILYTLNAADELVVLSEEWKNYFDSLTSRQKSVVVYNPVIMPDQVAPNRPGMPVEVLYLNHLTTKKGIFDIIEALAERQGSLRGKIRLTLAGSGSEEAALLERIRQAGIEDMIVCKGWVTGDAKHELLRNCQLFILTSYYEGLPMSILEAMAAGKPVIATRVGGIPTIVKPGINGWLLEPGDQKAIADTFEEVIRHPELLQQYGSQSQCMAQEYSAARVVEKLNLLYEGMLKGTALNRKAALCEK